jgi:curli production assembly/transport component CsgG
MIKIVLTLGLLLLSNCAVMQKGGMESKPEVTEMKMQKEFDTVPAPAQKKITVAVYSFQDKTGQRRNTPNIASFSTAVTQGAEPFLIKALQDVGKGLWFDVVERVNVDNLIKERTIIKQMREMYEGSNAKSVPPMQFAGIIIEGGIIGYDSGMESGGAGLQMVGHRTTITVFQRCGDSEFTSSISEQRQSIGHHHSEQNNLQHSRQHCCVKSVQRRHCFL